MREGKHTRRQFLGKSAGATLGALSAAAWSRVPGAGERLSIGIIGCGGRGTYLMGEIRKNAAKNVQVTAICDVWRPNRERMAAAVRKRWPDTQLRVFSRYQELLALEDVDAVTIATPDFMHCKVLADAARARKDAYCEKPMASNLADANDALESVLANKTIVQAGTQRRSDGRHRGGAELIRSGILGTVIEVETAWHDSNPRWARGYSDVRKEDVDWEAYQMDLPKRPFDPRRYRCWHLYKDYTVGLPGLLGSHLIDVAVWFMDDPLPRNAVCNGGIYAWKDGREHADTVECTWEYPNGWLLRYSSVLGNNRPTPECIFRGTRGSFDTQSWKATGEGGGKDKLKKDVAVKALKGENHVGNWLDCIRSRKTPNADIRVGYAHSIASIMAFRALESGHRQVFDPDKREIRAG